MKEAELRNILSANIKRYRTLRDLSQMALAEKLDISTNFLSDIERCKAWVSPQTLVRLADALEVEPFELLKNDLLPPAATASEKTVITMFADETVSAITQAIEGVRRKFM